MRDSIVEDFMQYNNIYEGQVFGKWTILNVKTTNKRKILAKCECGTIKEVSKFNVISGKSKSCGKGICHLPITLTDKKFGKLTVLGYGESRQTGNGGVLWKCLCECGNIKLARTRELKSGRTSSCGCATSSKLSCSIRMARGVPVEVGLQRKIYRNYKAQAQYRKYDFALSFEEFIALLKKPCYYCGVIHSKSEEQLYKDGLYCKFEYNGIDRVDNSIGYVVDNCVPCCYICNQSKSNLSLDEWQTWLKRLYLHQYTFNETQPNYPNGFV